MQIYHKCANVPKLLPSTACAQRVEREKKQISRRPVKLCQSDSFVADLKWSQEQQLLQVLQSNFYFCWETHIHTSSVCRQKLCPFWQAILQLSSLILPHSLNIVYVLLWRAPFSRSSQASASRRLWRTAQRTFLLSLSHLLDILTDAIR